MESAATELLILQQNLMMPTSHNCEVDECVDGSAVCPPTVYVHDFRSILAQYTWNQSVLSLVPWLLQAQHLSAGWVLGNEAIKLLTLEDVLECHLKWT